MKLWKLTQTVNNDYDTYDSIIVAAKTEEEALCIHPTPYVEEAPPWKHYGAWVKDPLTEVKATYLGNASPFVKIEGVILASFNAG